MQAASYRNSHNEEQLYVMLMRYARWVRGAEEQRASMAAGRERGAGGGEGRAARQLPHAKCGVELMCSSACFNALVLAACWSRQYHATKISTRLTAHTRRRWRCVGM
eukprot:359833-Chlamydomonas_euryale.AAC.21